MSSAVTRFFDRSLKLSHLRLLVMFAQHGQLRLVADQLNVSQPAVSKQLAELEKGVGAAILERVGNRLVFTALGEVLLRRAREVLFQLEHAQQDVQAVSDGLKGKLNIGAVATVFRSMAPHIVLDLKRSAPGVSVALVQATSDQLFPQLTSGALDLLLCRTVPSQIANGDFACKQLLDDPIVIVCARNHPLATLERLTPSDLAGWSWVLPPRSSPTFLALNSWMHEHQLSFPDGCVESISMSVNETLLNSFPFLSVMPASFLNNGVTGSQLVELELPRARFLEHIWMFYNRKPDRPLVFMAIERIEELVASGELAQRMGMSADRPGMA